VNTALGAPAHAGLTRAIVFSPIPFVPRCPGIPSHFVFFRPVNDPDLRNDILWVNHLSIDQNRQLVRSMGDRPGYVLQWNNQCQVSLRPLDGLTDEDVPPSRFVK
jgi:hypothetical protein